MSGEVATADPDRLDSMIRLNVVAPTRLAAAIVPGFVARGHGTLINIGSAVALAPEWVNGAYSGTKAYVLNLSLKLQQELAGTGVRVQVVLPGALRTMLWEKGGIDISTLPPDILMEAAEMVDAALVELDNGESVTIPSLPDLADWEAYEAARQNMLPKLSRNTPAPRYRAVTANAVGA
jgi:short-subunit dehydrogenase